VTDQPITAPPPRNPGGPVEHYCQHPGCKAWGGWGYSRAGGVIDWRCYEHRTEDHLGRAN
jgi:hypothetical protein